MHGGRCLPGPNDERDRGSQPPEHLDTCSSLHHHRDGEADTKNEASTPFVLFLGAKHVFYNNCFSGSDSDNIVRRSRRAIVCSAKTISVVFRLDESVVHAPLPKRSFLAFLDSYERATFL